MELWVPIAMTSVPIVTLCVVEQLSKTFGRLDSCDSIPFRTMTTILLNISRNFITLVTCVRASHRRVTFLLCQKNGIVQKRPGTVEFKKHNRFSFRTIEGRLVDHTTSSPNTHSRTYNHNKQIKRRLKAWRTAFPGPIEYPACLQYYIFLSFSLSTNNNNTLKKCREKTTTWEYQKK